MLFGNLFDPIIANPPKPDIINIRDPASKPAISGEGM